MSYIILPTFSAGAIFGAALAASGVYSPHIIMSQMRLQDFYMLQAFMTASATSAYVSFYTFPWLLNHCFVDISNPLLLA